MPSIREIAEKIAYKYLDRTFGSAKLQADIERALHNERERCAKIAETDHFAPVDRGGLCLECNEWTPPRHPERGEHKESCSWSWVNGNEFKGNRRIAAAIRKED